MKFFAFSAALLVGSSAAYQTPMTMVTKKLAVAKKGAPQKAAAKVASSGKFSLSSWAQEAGSIAAASRAAAKPSVALPYNEAPITCDGSLVGDFGFDPWQLSTAADGGTFLGKDWKGSTLKFYREAELTHGRIAQLAVVGYLWPGLFGTFPGNEWTGVDAYSATKPLEALTTVPQLALLQIVAAMSWIELRRFNKIKKEGADYVNGDLGLGQGEGRWNPLNFKYTPEQYEEKQLQEIKHCRLAMMGILGLWFQENNSGLGIVDQLQQGLASLQVQDTTGGYAF
jgi:hypothetical protein